MNPRLEVVFTRLAAEQEAIGLELSTVLERLFDAHEIGLALDVRSIIRLSDTVARMLRDGARLAPDLTPERV